MSEKVRSFYTCPLPTLTGNGDIELVVQLDGCGAAQTFEQGMPAVEAVKKLRKLADELESHVVRMDCPGKGDFAAGCSQEKFSKTCPRYMRTYPRVVADNLELPPAKRRILGTDIASFDLGGLRFYPEESA